MFENNDVIKTQDTSSNAMTEVALGLSMAFFALLIIALMSVSLPSKVNEVNHSRTNPQTSESPLSEQINLTVQENGSKESSAQSDSLILLYWGENFFNTEQEIVNVQTIQKLQNVIVAVDPNIPFNQLINIQSQLKGTTLRLTKLDEQWQHALQQSALNVTGSNL